MSSQMKSARFGFDFERDQIRPNRFRHVQQPPAAFLCILMFLVGATVLQIVFDGNGCILIVWNCF